MSATRTAGWVRLVTTAATLLLASCADYVGDDIREGRAQTPGGREAVALDGTTTTTIPPDPVDPRTLPDGACFDDPADPAHPEGAPPAGPAAIEPGAQVVPRTCAEEHRYEIYARGEVGTAEDVWPGEGAVAEAADTLCTPRFEEFVGSEWADSSLDYVALVPDDARWAAGDRVVTCLVIDIGLAPLIGSMAGTER